MRGKRPTLTPSQDLVLRSIKVLIGIYGYPPTNQEIADHLGFASTFGVRKHIDNLKDKGYISKRNHLARGIRIV